MCACLLACLLSFAQEHAVLDHCVLMKITSFLMILPSYASSLPLQDCTESDPYAGYEGALLCMDEVDSGGDIAFVKQSTVQTYSGDTALTSASDKVSGDCWFSDLPFLLCSPCSRH